MLGKAPGPDSLKIHIYLYFIMPMKLLSFLGAIYTISQHCYWPSQGIGCGSLQSTTRAAKA